MICPKKRISRARRDKRRASNWKISWPTIVTCKRCGSYFLTHHVCHECGYYNKHDVLHKSS